MKKKSIKQIMKGLRKFDFFGHPTMLLYRDDDTTMKTYQGGICSISICIYMIVFFLANLNNVHNIETS